MAGISVTSFRQFLASLKTELSDGEFFVPVGRKKFAKVDESDFERVNGVRWRERGAYAATMIDGSLVRMHHFILGTPASGKVIDHINRDPLDNRRANLRVCTVAENAKNRGANKNPRSSPFKGVCLAADGRWMATIQSDGVTHHLGVFEYERRAAKAYDRAAKRLHGEFAKTNAELGLY
jgi:hypothetical protein